MPTLSWRKKDGAKVVLHITKSIITIGSDPSNDVVVRDGGLDKHQAKIDFDGHGFTISEIEAKPPVEVNGKRMQTGNTNTMIFGVQKLLSYLSYFVTLMPGDIVSTGTPPGVGMGIKPKPVFLKSGDSMRVGIDGLGEQKQAVTGG